MPHARSEVAAEQLSRLSGTQVPAEVSLSFGEDSSLLTAWWAVKEFGPQALTHLAHDQHRAEGEQSGDLGTRQQELLVVAGEVAADLASARKRRARGYNLASFAVQGVIDTAAVIGSLEKAVEIHPDNLSGPADEYRQASARYILDHMQVVDSDDGRSVEFML